MCSEENIFESFSGWGFDVDENISLWVVVFFENMHVMGE